MASKLVEFWKKFKKWYHSEERIQQAPTSNVTWIIIKRHWYFRWQYTLKSVRSSDWNSVYHSGRSFKTREDALAVATKHAKDINFIVGIRRALRSAWYESGNQIW